MFDKDELGQDHFQEDHNNSAPSDSKKQPFVSFSVLNGFRCFFQNSVLQEGLAYHECYERVMKNHFQLEKIRVPTGQLLRKGGSLEKTSEELYRRCTAEDRLYLQSGDNIFKYTLGRDKEKEIEQMQRQLELYQRSAEEALVEKKRQLKAVREEKERLLQLEIDQRKRRQAVLAQLEGKEPS